jgi:hypothetical protein
VWLPCHTKEMGHLSSHKELNALIREITQAGYAVERTRSGHYAVRGPNGNRVYSLPSTPGRGRALANLRRALIRQGVLEK